MATTVQANPSNINSLFFEMLKKDLTSYLSKINQRSLESGDSDNYSSHLRTNSPSNITMHFPWSEAISEKEDAFEEEFHKLNCFPLTMSTTVLFKGEHNKYIECNWSLKQPKWTLLPWIKPQLQPGKEKIIQIPIIKYDIYNPLLFLNFNLCSAVLLLNKKKKNKFKLQVLGCTNPKYFKFKIARDNSNHDIYTKLTNYLHFTIISSWGFKTNIFGVSLRNDFHRCYFMKEREFAATAKTGDILIFRGMECPAACQRAYTGSQYDHVALWFRKKEKWFVYEATGKEGCKERPWSDFIWFLWNWLYEKIVYRRWIINGENIDETKKIQNDLQVKAEDYFNKTNGRKYLLKICPILCGGKVKENEKNNKWEINEGFSCSALVTGAYLNMGIISYDKEVDSVLPGKYAYESGLVLNKPFELAPEIIIDFTGN